MLSQDEYDGLIETLHILSNPANASRILRSIADAEAGRLEKHDLIEPGTRSAG